MMGGGGGSFFPSRVDAETLAQQTRRAEEQAQGQAFETSIADLLASELALFNGRDVERTRSIFESIKRDLDRDVEGAVDLLFGGSIAKHTYVDGLSDIDALVLMDRSEYRDSTPNQLQEVLARCLRDRYGNELVTVGKLAVTLRHSGQDIQLLPALRAGEKFKVGSYTGDEWSKINPDAFARALTVANGNLNGKLVPCIKLAKAIIGTFPESRQLSGYHTEALAIRVFRHYDGIRTSKAMLREFFERAPSHVRQPMRDSSGQSIHVDEYLGVKNSVERRIVADALGRVARRIRNADGARSVERWKELFE